MTRHYITLPNGHTCSIRCYVKSWRTVLTCNPSDQIRGWDHFPTSAASVLCDLRAGLHDRINRHIAWYGKGRKRAPQWQADAWRTAQDVNRPRLIVRWVPPDLRARLSHRVHNDSND